MQFYNAGARLIALNITTCELLCLKLLTWPRHYNFFYFGLKNTLRGLQLIFLLNSTTTQYMLFRKKYSATYI